MTRSISRGVLSFLAVATFAVGCANSGGEGDECFDGEDNDGDGLVDGEDPACIAGETLEVRDPLLPDCNDSADNDGDGLRDYPSDPGCDSLEDDDEFNDEVPECRDGIDNDGDGYTDFPNDPGCLLDLQDNELDDCPDGPNCPDCRNGVDDDDDGDVDYPDDNGCDTAADLYEEAADPGDCGGDVTPINLPATGIADGTAVANSTNDLISPDCGGSGQEAVYVLTLDAPRTLTMTTDFSQTTLDTVVYIRSECRGIDTELACDDDGGEIVPSASSLQVRVDPGTYYIIVDGFSAGSSGNFHLEVKEYLAPQEECDPENNDCPPGYVCRFLDPNATVETCELPACMDTIDSDGDGIIDFPDEPGCTALDDPDESDDCPTGPNCPACGDTEDNDLDGLIDYSGDDPGCHFAGDEEELDECVTGLPVTEMDQPTETGVTTGTSLLGGSCGGGFAPEAAWLYVADRDLRSLTFTTLGSTLSTVLYIYRDVCGLNELACQDGFPAETITFQDPALGDYFAIVDGAFGSGAYQLGVSGVVAGGEVCDLAETNFPCEPGFFCGSGVCIPTDCNDDLDNDADGLFDFPFDPGCQTVSDTDEVDDCPDGPTCPACSNTEDDDADGVADFGDDPGCAAASDPSEIDNCVPGLEIGAFVGASVTGTTSGTSLLFSNNCGGFFAPEDAWVYPVERDLRELTFSTAGSSFDTILYAYDDVCGTGEIGCADLFPNEELTIDDPAQTDYFVIVDGWNIGNYVLSVSGVLAGGEDCDLAETNFVCEVGYFCDGTVCAPTICNDDGDNDGDGLLDYPEDPGCSSVADNDEADDCPNGPTCPACSNDEDDDEDGLFDYGFDPGCEAAGDTSEVDNCVPGLPVGSLVPTSGVTDTTSGSSFLTSNCGSNFGPEKAYVLNIDRDLENLTFSTEGSTLDTILYVYYDTCGVIGGELQCLDNWNLPEEITIEDPAQGDYFAVVDSFSIGEFVLSARGVISPGEYCEAVDTQFVCSSGYACVASVCVPSACNDDTDNDGDGETDFPFDPGCATQSDNDEFDTCPGAGCPACANGSDDDSDGFIDFAADVGCFAAGDPAEADCDGETNPVGVITAGLTTGSTIGLTNNFEPSCSSGSGADKVYVLQVPGFLETLHIDTLNSFDTVVMVKTPDCNSGDIACNDEGGIQFGASNIDMSDAEAGSYRIIVDGWNGGSGNYNLNVHGVLRGGESCDAATITSGLFSCEAGFSCNGGICAAALCNNGEDDDLDSLVDDYDPGCSDISDNAEGPNPVPPPECADGVDNDGDGEMDYPEDNGCERASDDLELPCTDPDLFELLEDVTTGSTTGAVNNSTGECSWDGGAPEEVYIIDFPGQLTSLTATTNGTAWDTVLYIQSGECGGPSLGCNDDNGTLQSTVTASNLAAGTYFIFVDGYSNNFGSYTLTVTGVIAPGEACDSEQITAGILSCGGGTSCNAGVCN